ncbi:3-hydroxyisobutyrate dehydrogenase/putative dehydrogenase [Plantibacter sp. VKM Ac-1784]|uniref:3-hydroxyisobutyrate dehydrogenase/putative dehydrogenase n=1 Tax=Plantibacter elymi (nom. nud.) TaxID=199708 RepID=A0ABY1RH54_9MICO|nr:NAD(P)-dependent oxidoreductase [Plantibacter sp. VKM Ac-1784]SMQ72769.1 3-hydroxyisobutyrate dehydrogenase/putative dehydrogenase [Plantibacter sp. VKM Ac-1784]
MATTPQPATTLTFVGIGAIGLPMAAQLVAAGHCVTGVDPFPTAHERASAVGLDAVSSIAEAPRAEVVIVMVATPDQLSTLVDQALEATDVAGQTWVVMSTVGPASVAEQGARLTGAGASVVDAPVTGGVARARTGELSLFVSGPTAATDAVSGVLGALGAVRIVGEAVGDGQGIKVVNQHLCAVHIVAAAEALALAESLGLDPATVLPLVESGAAASWMLSDRGPRMLQGTDVEVTSQINIFVKDAGLVADAASAAGASTPVLDAARERYLAAAEAGLGTRDDSRVIETYRPSI